MLNKIVKQICESNNIDQSKRSEIYEYANNIVGKSYYQEVANLPINAAFKAWDTPTEEGVAQLLEWMVNNNMLYSTERLDEHNDTVSKFNKLSNHLNQRIIIEQTPEEATGGPGIGGEVPPAGEGEAVATPLEPAADVTTPDDELGVDAMGADTMADDTMAAVDDPGAIGGETEEIDVTQLVTSGQETSTKVTDLASKVDGIVNQVNDIINNFKTIEQSINQSADANQTLQSKLDNLQIDIDSMRPPTPEERIDLISMDSGPFNTSLQDYWSQKETNLEKLRGQKRSGGMEGNDQIEDLSVFKNVAGDVIVDVSDVKHTDAELKKTFNPDYDEDEEESGDFKVVNKFEQ